MRRFFKSISAGLTGLALAATPAAADWLGWGEGYEYGLNEYGYGLAGGYDGEDESDDWYYDSYESDDSYTGTYGDGDADNVRYDSDLFGDDEWESENEGFFEDTSISGDEYEDGDASETDDGFDSAGDDGYGYDGYGYDGAAGDDGLNEDGFYGNELYEDGADR